MVKETHQPPYNNQLRRLLIEKRFLPIFMITYIQPYAQRPRPAFKWIFCNMMPVIQGISMKSAALCTAQRRRRITPGVPRRYEMVLVNNLKTHDSSSTIISAIRSAANISDSMSRKSSALLSKRTFTLAGKPSS